MVFFKMQQCIGVIVFYVCKLVMEDSKNRLQMSQTFTLRCTSPRTSCFSLALLHVLLPHSQCEVCPFIR